MLTATQTLYKMTSTNVNGKIRAAYYANDAKGEMIATVNEKTSDGNIHEILWYGGERHGKSTLTEGGIEGLMDALAA